MEKQGGFTLIELVVVIVILGILAVTAAPKFLNLQDDARDSALQGLKGAMGGAVGIVYGKAAIAGNETVSDGSATVDTTIKIMNGYPQANSSGIGNAVTGLSTDWDIVSGSNTSNSGTIAYTFKGNTTATASSCSVSYEMLKTEDEPKILVHSCK